MSSLASIKDQFASIFNKASGLNVKYEDLKRQGPVAIDASYPPGYRTRNTVVTFTNSDKILNISYDRTPIADRVGMPGGVPIVLTMDQDGSYYKLLPLISERVGVVIEQNEIAPGTFDIESMPGVITLTATSASLRWLPGSTFEVKIMGSYRVHDGVCEMVPMDFPYKPDIWEAAGKAVNQADGTRCHPVLNTGQYDYTPIANILSGYRSRQLYSEGGTTIVAAVDTFLVHALNSIDGLDWKISTNGNQISNFYGARIIYNGPAKDAKGFVLKGNVEEVGDTLAAADIRATEFDNVMLIWLNSTYNKTMLPGVVPIHYNNKL